MTRRRVARALAGWAVAGAIIVWLARGIPFGTLAASLRQAQLALFLAVMLASFLGWFFGETLLFSRLFTYLQSSITWLEMLPMTATLYFTQVVNGALAGGVFTVLIHRRKGVHWLESGFTMLLLGLVDFQIMSLMALVAALLGRHSPLRYTWRYAAVALALSTAVAAFWLAGRPSLPVAAKLYDWKPMSGFRRARPIHYLKLAAIRTPIFLLQGLTLYLCLRSFDLHVPISYVLTLTPAILLVTALPITPIGIGSEQAAVVLGFQAYGPRATLLAMSLAMSALGLLLRLALAPFAAQTV